MVRIKDYKANCRGLGHKPVGAWANSYNSAIVTHRQVGMDGELYGRWILAHRVSGLTIRSWSYFYEDRKAALKAAARIERFSEWKQIGRPETAEGKIPGWTKKLAKSLDRRVSKALPSSTYS